MAISTFEIAGIILLFILLGVSVWWFVVADKYKKYMSTNYPYTRGAHAWEEGQTLNLKCDGDSEICVYRATQIYTNPDSNNFEDPNTDPIASGTNSNATYGAFDPQTTVDRTVDLGGECNGKNSCFVNFVTSEWPTGMVLGNAGTPQLISTYTCIPSGGTCTSYSG